MKYADIPPERLFVVVVIVLIVALAVSRRAGLDLGKSIAIGVARAAMQLLGVGYVLVALFARQSPMLVLAAVGIMLAVAAWTASRRVVNGPPARALAPRALLAIAVGSATALVPVFALVLAPSPWFDARVIVPISGMIVANAMNVVAQVNERIFAGVASDRAEVEQWLALGASPRQALARHTREALRAALIPTVNGLLTVGIVSLPGMMTGQIVGGIAPDHAVRYQLVILYQLVMVAAVSGAAASFLARRVLFDADEQLRSVEWDERS